MSNAIKVKKFFPKGQPHPNVAELLADERFSRFAEHAIAEYERTGLLRDVRYFLNTFADTPFYHGLIKWLGGRIGLEYKWPVRRGEIILSINPDSIIANPDLGEFLDTYSGTFAELRKAWAQERHREAELSRERRKQKKISDAGGKSLGKSFPKRKRKRKAKKKKTKGKAKRKIDAMWRRLPGSFGSGRR